MRLSERILHELDHALRTCFAPARTVRPDPAAESAAAAEPPALSGDEVAISVRLMRVNHAGEISAQALYRGQALLARNPATRAHLLAAAAEENDHLGWCEARLDELGGSRSLLTPFWYAGSFLVGAGAAATGDSTSFGFIAETERQVEAHLEDHLERLPAADFRSRAILSAMAEDEARHGDEAQQAGAAQLPPYVKAGMALGGQLLRKIALVV